MRLKPSCEELRVSFSSIEAFESLRDEPHSFLLDSCIVDGKLGRYSFLGANPFLILRSKGRRVELIQGGKREYFRGNPLLSLQSILNQYQIDPLITLPLPCGGVGYLSYELRHLMERLPSKALDDMNLPDCYLCFYDEMVIFDHMEERTYLASLNLPHQGSHSLKEHLMGSSPTSEEGQSLQFSEAPLQSNFTKEDYIRAIEKAKDYIRAGEIYQVNLSQRFSCELPLPPWELYRRLRMLNPAPFAAYLNFDGATILSSSPERFLKVSGRGVQTRPIKGTRPRGRTIEGDERMAKELLRSSKDRAELVMIVDLERNDLGRVCEYGSVRVTEPVVLERYSTVFHTVATIEGKLKEGKDRIDLLKATFPGGSITGAPKIRSMEIIDELEPTQRGIYTGSIGYLSFDGGMDLNIVIRTIVVKGNKLYFQVGGGIVADSDPEEEYQETLDKAKALIQALSATPKELLRSPIT